MLPSGDNYFGIRFRSNPTLVPRITAIETTQIIVHNHHRLVEDASISFGVVDVLSADVDTTVASVGIVVTP